MDDLGNVVRIKARIVAQNVYQEERIDFNYIFLILGLIALFFIDDKWGEKVKHILMYFVISIHMFRGNLLLI